MLGNKLETGSSERLGKEGRDVEESLIHCLNPESVLWACCSLPRLHLTHCTDQNLPVLCYILSQLIFSLEHNLGNKYKRISFYSVCKDCTFYKLKVCSKPASGSLWEPFSQQHLLTSCLCVTFWQSSEYFTLFHYYIWYGDLWSVIFAVTSLTHWRLRWWLA